MSGYAAEVVLSPEDQRAFDVQDAKASIDGTDVLDELHEVHELLADLCKAGETKLVGELVRGVFEAYAGRLASINRFGEYSQDDVHTDDVGAEIRAKWRAQNEARVQKWKEAA